MHLEVGGHHVLTLSFTIFRKIGSLPSLQVAICIAIHIGHNIKDIIGSHVVEAHATATDFLWGI